MSNFAKIEKGIVVQVIVSDEAPAEGEWVQTSYNTRGGVHYGKDGKPDGGEAMRGNYAGIGHVYDAENDAFHAPQPFQSWSMNKKTWTWEAPVPYPDDKGLHIWDEKAGGWVSSVGEHVKDLQQQQEKK